MSESIPTQPDRKFGTFGGVFTPNVLTILGVVMFLLAPWVVGTAGLSRGLMILLIANGITLLTGLSLSAISTNTRVGAGGAYFLISRSLGLEIGGSIGLPLFLAQAISVAFYIIGFTLSLGLLFSRFDHTWFWSRVPADYVPFLTEYGFRLISLSTLGVFFVMAWRGANLIIKAQYVILALLALSLVSFFAGHPGQGSLSDNWSPQYGVGESFWGVFAIFFPAVTGIMAGVSMSGDLKDPAKAIPRGTLLAVVVTFFIYAAQMIWLALNADRQSLLSQEPTNFVMGSIAAFEPLIFVGLWAATLSSGLASLLAAPRTLQALANDGILPQVLGRSERNNEPRIATIICTAVAAVCIVVGDLKLIAPLITMFFLATYGTVNMVAALEGLVSNPSYRPTFRVHWAFSAVGAFACLQVMFLIDPAATVLAVLVIAGIYVMLTRRRFHTAWGDMRSGFWFAITRLGLLRFTDSRQHVRNWRPVLLVLAGDPRYRSRLVEFAVWIESRRGMLFIAQVVEGQWDHWLPRLAGIEASMQAFVRENRLAAIVKTILADNFEKGVTTLLQVGGLGQFKPNTVLMGWSEDTVRKASFAQTIRHILQLERNLLIFREAPAAPSSLALEPVIDVWWHARMNGTLMLTLADLLRASSRWRHHRLRVLRVVSDESSRQAVESDTRQAMADLRIKAELRVLVEIRPILEVIAEESRSSEVCFVGLAIDASTPDAAPLERYTPLVGSMRGNLFFTKSWEDLRLLGTAPHPATADSAGGEPMPPNMPTLTSETSQDAAPILVPESSTRGPAGIDDKGLVSYPEGKG